MPRLATPLYALYIALGALYGLLMLVIEPQEPAVFFLWLLALLIMVVRLRFRWTKTAWMEAVAWVLVGFLIDGAHLLAAPAAMVAMAQGHPLTALVLGIGWVVFDLGDVALLTMVVYAIGLGLLLYAWELSRVLTRKRTDSYRERMYDLEREQRHLIESQDEMSRLSVITERDRIAQKLHDDLGHELTGALLALRAHEVTNPSAIEDSSFTALKGRLENAVDQLKQTVHGTQSEESLGLERMQHTIDSFRFCPVNFKREGALSALSPMQWHLLHSVLKEALTNVQKHTKATRVEVELTISGKIVRLLIRNDGLKEGTHKSGMGLRYMRRRLEGVGGTLSIQRNYHFTLVCTVPATLEGVV